MRKGYLSNKKNIINNGFVDSNEDYIFYSNFNDHNKLYRMDNSNKPIKLSDYKAKFINLKGQWVYYVNNIGNLIIRVKTDGTCEEIFYKIDIPGDQIEYDEYPINNMFVSNFIIYDNYALFTECEELIRIDLTTKEIEKFHFYKNNGIGCNVGRGPIYNVFLHKEYLYFLDDNRSIYKIPINYLNRSFLSGYKELLKVNNQRYEDIKEQLKQLNPNINNDAEVESFFKSNGCHHILIVYGEDHCIDNAKNLFKFIIDKDFLYYIKAESGEWGEYHSNIHKMDLTDNRVNGILEAKATSLYIIENLLIYIDADNDYKLTINKSGLSNVININDVVDINAVKDKIYFYDRNNALYQMMLDSFEVSRV